MTVDGQANESVGSISIGEFTLDCATGVLSGHGTEHRLARQPQKLLEILHQHAGDLVSRQILFDRLWPNGQTVDFDQSLNACIRKLRKCLNDNAEKPRFIETIPGRGYRLLVIEEPVGLPVSERWQLLFAVMVGAALLVALLIWPGHQDNPDKALIEFAALTEPNQNHYLRGKYLAEQGDSKSLSNALVELNTVLETAPAYSQAYFLVADIYLKQASLQPAEAGLLCTLAEQFALQGLALDKNQASPYLTLAYIDLYHHWDLASAWNHLEQAQRLDPANAKVHSLLAAWYAINGRGDSAIDSSKQAVLLEPESMMINADLCWYYNFDNQFQTATRVCRQALELAPASQWTHLGLVESLRQQQRIDQAARELATLLNKTMIEGTPEQQLRQLFHQWLVKVETAYREKRVDAYSVAAINAMLGQTDQALSWLKISLENRDGFFLFIATDSRFAALRDLPEFKLLVGSINRVS